jgi:hypothetical protein
MRRLFSQKPARSMSKQQAMAVLGYSETHFSRLLNGGVIRGVRIAKLWYVDADHVEQIAREMKRNGTIRMDLSAAPGMDKERSRGRAYYHNSGKARRAARRQAATA